MCRTSAPPRRELYELGQTMLVDSENSTADKGGFFMPESKPRPPRIGSLRWVTTRGEHAVAVFNGAYGPDGEEIDVAEEPWTVITPDGEWSHFWTHAEAIAYAFKETA